MIATPPPVPAEGFRVHLTDGSYVDRTLDQFFDDLWVVFESLSLGVNEAPETLDLYRLGASLTPGDDALRRFAEMLGEAIDDLGIEGPRVPRACRRRCIRPRGEARCRQSKTS